MYLAIERLIQSGEQVGLTILELIRMLDSGMTLESLFDLIEVRMASTCVTESRAS